MFIVFVSIGQCSSADGDCSTCYAVGMRRSTELKDLSACAGMLLAALLGIVAASAGAIAQTSGAIESDEPISTQRAVIRFLTADDYPPFNSRDEEGVLTGLNIDLARAICQELGATCDITARPWNLLLQEIRDGKGDAVAAAHKVTAKALEFVNFSDRYFYTPGRFAVRREMRPVSATPSGLEELKAGVVAGSPHEAYLQRFFPNTAVSAFNTPEIARLALQNRQVDALFGDGISLSFWANGSLSRNCCRLLDGAFFEPAYFGDGLAIGVNKKDRDLLGQINGALERIRESGQFSEFVGRYFPIRVY